MKFSSKEALLLGGTFIVLDTPFSLLGLELLGDIIFWGFNISLVLLCLNKTPKFLTKINEGYPRFSYYVSSFGWVVYFFILCFLLYVIGAQFIEFSPEFNAYYFLGLTAICVQGIVISLVVAFVRKRREVKNKE